MKHLNFTKRSSINRIKVGLLFACFALIRLSGYSQTYAWMKGSPTADQPGLYGTLGVPATNNNPGGREAASNWRDAAGNFWVFGGFGWDNSGGFGFLNDLWKYTVSSNQWTWVSGTNVVDQDGIYGTMGVPAVANMPGGRQSAATWIDASGNLWLFGGFGFDGSTSVGELNDLWKFNVTTNQWTWIKGSNIVLANGSYGTLGTAGIGNTPGARAPAASWTDNAGNLWLMGGSGYDGSGNFGDLNDLWKYNAGTNQWTWMKGANGVDNNGIYGTIGVAAAANTPGGRYLSSHFTDLSGNLWISGGAGYDASSGTEDLLNDLWKYDVSTNQWTWMSGSNTSGQNGVYGTMGTASPLNIPGGRLSSASMRDAAGNFYIFGGFGYDSASGADAENDLWKYNVTTNQWTWMTGSNLVGQSGVYGTQGVAAAGNTPGARGSALGFTDASDNLWIFGGFGYDENGISMGDMNDLWRLTSCNATPTITISGSSSGICLGSAVTFTAGGASTYSWSNTQTGSVISVIPSVSGVLTATAYGTDLSGCAGSKSISVNVFALPVVNATTNKAVICKGEQAVITGSGAVTYTWNTNSSNTGASVVVSPTTTTIYAVTGTDANGCSKTFSVVQTVNLCTGVENNGAMNPQFSVYPNPGNGAFNVSGPVFGENVSLVIYNQLGQKVFESVLNNENTFVQTQLLKGIYQYNVLLSGKRVNAGKIIVE